MEPALELKTRFTHSAWIPVGTAFSFILAFYQTMMLLTGKFQASAFSPWLLPGLSLVGLLLLFDRGIRARLFDKWGLNFLLVIATVAIAFAVWNTPGLQIYLPRLEEGPLARLAPLTLSIPILSFFVWLIAYLSQTPSRDEDRVNGRFKLHVPTMIDAIVVGAVSALAFLIPLSTSFVRFIPKIEQQTLFLAGFGIIIALAVVVSLIAHRLSPGKLPPGLRPAFILPAMALWIMITGGSLTLPVGPLCDDGMILFMEGGCDFGGSNIFFFSRLGLLLAINFLIINAMRYRTFHLRLSSHYLMTAAAFGLSFLLGTHACDVFYDHPQGHLGQSIIEIAAFGILGLAIAARTASWSSAGKLSALLGWNAVHVGLFYLYLLLTPHWSWLHTLLLSASLVVLALLVKRFHHDTEMPLPKKNNPKLAS